VNIYGHYIFLYFSFNTFAKIPRNVVFPLSLVGIVCRWVRKIYISAILNSGSDTRKCGINEGVRILSEGSVCEVSAQI
jgi:hypothetical protein